MTAAHTTEEVFLDVTPDNLDDLQAEWITFGIVTLDDSLSCEAVIEQHPAEPDVGHDRPWISVTAVLCNGVDVSHWFDRYQIEEDLCDE